MSVVRRNICNCTVCNRAYWIIIYLLFLQLKIQRCFYLHEETSNQSQPDLRSQPKGTNTYGDSRYYSVLISVLPELLLRHLNFQGWRFEVKFWWPMNYCYFILFKLFLDNVETFIRQVESVAFLNLFLSDVK